MDSGKLSADLHDALGKNGLADLTDRQRDAAIIRQVESLLRKDQVILDLGCGYGRIAVPLLKKGFDIYGIDLSAKFIREIKRNLDGSLRRRFRVANMCDLPFRDNTFDSILCLWSAFDELLYKKEQLRAVKEMRRVLKAGGTAIIEGHVFTDPALVEKLKLGSLCGYRKRILKEAVSGLPYHHYNHDEASMSDILRRSRVRNYSVRREWFGWRDRLISGFSK